MTTKPLVLEGDLTVENEDHYVCAGDLRVNGNLLVLAMERTLGFGFTTNSGGGLGDWATEKNYGRVRITVERLP